MARRSEKDTLSKGTSVAKLKKRIIPVAGLKGKITALIYGRSGTGKTTMAASIIELPPVVEEDNERVLLLDIKEEGTDSVYDQPGIDVLEIDTYADFIGAHEYLKEYEHPYRAVIIDTLTQLQTLAMDEAKIRADLGPDAAMNRRSWGFLSSMLNPKLLEYRDLPMHVAFVAQDRRDDMDEEEEDLLPEVGPALMPSIAKTVNAMVKVIGQTYIKQTEIQKKGKLITRTTHRLRLGPHPLYLTKVRSPKKHAVPGSIPNPSFAKIAEIIRGEYGKKE